MAARPLRARKDKPRPSGTLKVKGSTLPLVDTAPARANDNMGATSRYSSRFAALAGGYAAGKLACNEGERSQNADVALAEKLAFGNLGLG
jgi:hypothetical protein